MKKRNEQEHKAPMPERGRRGPAAPGVDGSAEDFALHLAAMFRAELGEEDGKLDPLVNWELPVSEADYRQAASRPEDSDELLRAVADFLSDETGDASPAKAPRRSQRRPQQEPPARKRQTEAPAAAPPAEAAPPAPADAGTEPETSPAPEAPARDSRSSLALSEHLRRFVEEDPTEALLAQAEAQAPQPSPKDRQGEPRLSRAQRRAAEKKEKAAREAEKRQKPPREAEPREPRQEAPEQSPGKAGRAPEAATPAREPENAPREAAPAPERMVFFEPKQNKKSFFDTLGESNPPQTPALPPEPSSLPEEAPAEAEVRPEAQPRTRQERRSRRPERGPASRPTEARRRERGVPTRSPASDTRRQTRADARSAARPPREEAELLREPTRIVLPGFDSTPFRPPQEDPPLEEIFTPLGLKTAPPTPDDTAVLSTRARERFVLPEDAPKQRPESQTPALRMRFEAADAEPARESGAAEQGAGIKDQGSGDGDQGSGIRPARRGRVPRPAVPRTDEASGIRHQASGSAWYAGVEDTPEARSEDDEPVGAVIGRPEDVNEGSRIKDQGSGDGETDSSAPLRFAQNDTNETEPVVGAVTDRPPELELTVGAVIGRPPELEPTVGAVIGRPQDDEPTAGAVMDRPEGAAAPSPDFADSKAFEAFPDWYEQLLVDLQISQPGAPAEAGHRPPDLESEAAALLTDLSSSESEGSALVTDAPSSELPASETESTALETILSSESDGSALETSLSSESDGPAPETEAPAPEKAPAPRPARRERQKRRWFSFLFGNGDEEQGSGIKDQGSGDGDQGSGIPEQASGIRHQASDSAWYAGVEDTPEARSEDDEPVGAVIGRPEDANEGSGIKDQGSGDGETDSSAPLRFAQNDANETEPVVGAVTDRLPELEPTVGAVIGRPKDANEGSGINDQGSRIKDQGSGAGETDSSAPLRFTQNDANETESAVGAVIDRPQDDEPTVGAVIGRPEDANEGSGIKDQGSGDGETDSSAPLRFAQNDTNETEPVVGAVTDRPPELLSRDSTGSLPSLEELFGPASAAPKAASASEGPAGPAPIAELTSVPDNEPAPIAERRSVPDDGPAPTAEHTPASDEPAPAELEAAAPSRRREKRRGWFRELLEDVKAAAAARAEEAERFEQATGDENQGSRIKDQGSGDGETDSSAPLRFAQNDTNETEPVVGAVMDRPQDDEPTVGAVIGRPEDANEGSRIKDQGSGDGETDSSAPLRFAQNDTNETEPAAWAVTDRPPDDEPTVGAVIGRPEDANEGSRIKDQGSGDGETDSSAPLRFAQNDTIEPEPVAGAVMDRPQELEPTAEAGLVSRAEAGDGRAEQSFAELLASIDALLEPLPETAFGAASQGPAPEPLPASPPAEQPAQASEAPAFLPTPSADAAEPEAFQAARAEAPGEDWDPLALFGDQADDAELPSWEDYLRARRAPEPEAEPREAERPAPEPDPRAVTRRLGDDTPYAAAPEPELSLESIFGKAPAESPEPQTVPMDLEEPEQAAPAPGKSRRRKNEAGALTLEDFLAAAVPMEETAQAAPARPQARKRKPAGRNDTISTARENPDGLVLTRSRGAARAPEAAEPPRDQHAREPEPSADPRPKAPAAHPHRESRREIDVLPPEEQSVLHPEEAYRVYARPLDRIGSQLVLTGLFTILSLFFTLYLAQGWTFLPELFSGGTTVYILLGLLGLMILVNRKLYFRDWHGKNGLRPELLLGLATLFTALDCFPAAQALRPPFTVVVGALLMITLWGRYDRNLALMNTVKVLRAEKLSAGVSEVSDITKGTRGLTRTEPDVDRFMAKLETRDLTERVLRWYSLVALVGGGVLTLLITLLLKRSFLWTGALVYLGLVPVTGLLAYPRLFCLLSGRLAGAQAALCGYHGAEAFGGEHAILIGDDDIFPPGSLTLNGFKVYSGNPDRVIAYAAAACRMSGSALDPVFEDLLVTHNGRHYNVDNFRFYDSGGIGASIQQDVVLMGSLDFMRRMGVHMDRGARVKQAVYMSLNGELAAVFAVRYSPPENLRKGLAAIAGNRHFKGILVTRTFLGTPGFLKVKFGIPTGAFQYPSTKERIRLSEAELKRTGAQGAILAKDSFSGFAQAAAGGRMLRSATLGAALLTLLAGAVGLVLMGVLAALAATETATALNLLLYTAVWLAPTLLLTAWGRHF